MSKHTITLCAMLSGLTVVPAFGQDLVLNTELGQIDFYKYWQAQLPLQEDEEVLEVHLVDENIYAITNHTNLYAVHADIGTIRWSVHLGGQGSRIFRPTHVRSFWGMDLTLVSTSDRIQWFERATGKSIAKLEIDFVPSTPAMSDGVRVYVGGLDLMLHCFELVPTATGVSAIEKWRVRTDAVLSAAPVLWGGGLFFASHDGKVRACDSYDKSRFWVFRAGSAISADIYVDSTGVYFGSTDRHIYKLDVHSGRGLWRFPAPGIIRTQPVLVGEILYQKVEGEGICAINTDTGEQVWRAPDASGFISASDQRVYMLTRHGDIVALDPDTGKVDGRISAGNVDVVSRNPASSAMYLGSRRGRLLCAQDKSVPYLRFEQLQARSQGQEKAAEQPARRERTGSEAPRPALIDLLRSKSDATALSD